MDTTESVKLFRNNWFRRNEAHLELTPAEEQLIAAALGRAPKRRSGTPDMSSGWKRFWPLNGRCSTASAHSCSRS